MGIWARSQREAQARHVLLASGRRNGEGGGGWAPKPEMSITGDLGKPSKFSHGSSKYIFLV